MNATVHGCEQDSTLVKNEEKREFLGAEDKSSINRITSVDTVSQFTYAVSRVPKENTWYFQLWPGIARIFVTWNKRFIVKGSVLLCSAEKWESRTRLMFIVVFFGWKTSFFLFC